MDTHCTRRGFPDVRLLLMKDISVYMYNINGIRQIPVVVFFSHKILLIPLSFFIFDLFFLILIFLNLIFPLMYPIILHMASKKLVNNICKKKKINKKINK